MKKFVNKVAGVTGNLVGSKSSNKIAHWKLKDFSLLNEKIDVEEIFQ